MNKKRQKSIYFLGFVLFLLAGVVFVQISSAYTKTVEKERELDVLKEELTLEEEKNEQLQEDRLYIQTDEFVKKKARQEFNLIEEGEIIFIKKDED